VYKPEEELIETLKRNGVDFTASLPCEKVKTLLEMVGAQFTHVPLTREEEGVGICAGAALAGKVPAMFIQSSGVGNMINALLSLTLFYQLPLALFVSRRGVYREKIEAQVPMGQRLPKILQAAGVPVSLIDTQNDLPKVGKKLGTVLRKDGVHAFLISPAVWEGSECAATGRACGAGSPGAEPRTVPSDQRTVPARSLTRFDILAAVANKLTGKVVVCNLGWPSKELYAIRHQPSNFYMLGSMGMVTPIGLGIALSTKKDVVVIDGDGSLLMNPGTLATAAAFAPKNLTVLAIDNGAYGSTGNQPTLARSCVDLSAVARGFGIHSTHRASTAKDLVEAMEASQGSFRFVHALAVPGNADVPNIPLDRMTIKRQVQDFIGNQ
jgi:sulfopyruvate decarboxylase beta subunit